MDPATLALLITKIGLPAAQYLFQRIKGGQEVTDEDFLKLKDLKSADELYTEATGTEAPTITG